ncbi:MAG: site-specific integrase [Elusimicrobia bacterium]|nr:site-specific integrase [Elusimicrobiota bacterium]MDE2424467.1 site-specific integrase [Elusimicrobiota bacterium]
MAIIKKGDNWFIDYRANGRRIREKVGASRKLAESVLAKRKLEIAEKRFLNVRKASNENFRDFSARYIEWERGRIRTVGDDEKRVKRLLKTFGSMPLVEIDVPIVEQYMAQRLKEPKQHHWRGRSGRALEKRDKAAQEAKIAKWTATKAKTISKATVNREVAFLRKLLNKAVEWKVIPVNPIFRIKLFDERESIRKRYLKPEEIQLLLQCCTPAARNVVTFALYTGRRFGEIIGMRWQEVDLANGYVYFPRTKKKEPDQVAIPPRALEVLKTLYAARHNEFVFAKERGGQGPLKYVRSQFVKALTKAGIKDFRFHDLRHTAVSYMMMNGIDLKTIAELVGHTTAQMVDQRYGHLSPDHKRVATEIFGSAMDRLCGFASEVRDVRTHYRAGPKPNREGLRRVKQIDRSQSGGAIRPSRG